MRSKIKLSVSGVDRWDTESCADFCAGEIVDLCIDRGWQASEFSSEVHSEGKTFLVVMSFFVEARFKGDELSSAFVKKIERALKWLRGEK